MEAGITRYLLHCYLILKMGGMEGQREGWILKTCKSQTCKCNNAGRICMSGVCELWRPVLENELTKVSLNIYCAMRSKTKPNCI